MGEKVEKMVSVVLYVFFPVLLTIGILRKYRARQWGQCKSISSLQGKVFLVTGANSGIGKETVRNLARRKARIIMACRDMNNAKSAIEEIRRDVASGELIPMHLDLSSLSSVRQFAEEVLKDFPQIHVLINNAGVYVPVQENRKTKDGFEIHFGVNHLSHFLLTNLLLPRLKESAPSRIVNVSSTLYQKGEIEFDNLRGEKGFPIKGRQNPGYNNSKLANVLFTKELAQRLDGTGVDVYVLCPGFAYTGLFRYTHIKWYYYILATPVLLYFMRSASQAAQTVLHCATEESLEGQSGLMYRDCSLFTSDKILDPDKAAKLWAVSEELCGLKTETLSN
ncbi:unnamed protein product [Timema podura]|nr:unnamed protein product [Timema bartmani]CAD7456364.1 unnamed protein product [Timema tahoe]CAG2059097.1 unnamed protein product [Timema podura]